MKKKLQKCSKSRNIKKNNKRHTTEMCRNIQKSIEKTYKQNTNKSYKLNKIQ